MHCVSARVYAVLGRSRKAAEPEYQASLRCEEWEVVVPELIYEPWGDGGLGGM
jgi:ATP-dependent DNA helicase RecQ